MKVGPMGEILKHTMMLNARKGGAHLALTARRVGILVMAGLLVAVLSLAAIGCAIAAFWIAVLPHLGPALAALAASGIVLMITVFVVAVAITLLKSRPELRPMTAISGADLAKAAGKEFEDHKAALLTAALIAGFFAFNSKSGA